METATYGPRAIVFADIEFIPELYRRCLTFFFIHDSLPSQANVGVHKLRPHHVGGSRSGRELAERMIIL
jgi:hypothetical protein